MTVQNYKTKSIPESPAALFEQVIRQFDREGFYISMKSDPIDRFSAWKSTTTEFQVSKNFYSMKMIKFSSFLFFWLPFAAAITSDYVPCDDCIDRATPSVLAEISLRLYPNETIDEYKSVLVGDALDLCDSINASKSTILYIFGWTENPTNISVQTVVGAYLKRQDHNIIVLNWQNITAQIYPYAAFSVLGVGYTAATALNKLVAAGCVSSSTLYVVGHSLGGQTAGAVGRNVNFTLERIIGLDPAGPGYYVLIPDLTSADAKFVEVIHTDAGVLGTTINSGTINFHPNGGVPIQPGCFLTRVGTENCNHARSWIYFAESLLNENAFIGVECSSYRNFKSGSCDSTTPAVVMGYATPSNTSGNYYLQTNSESPYGRGISGETYSRTVALQNLES